ncbi:MAG: carbamate kinase [Pseudonocardiales bacterium]|jgi:carbamate kinase|nr:carbamate kinase [Pseudonocardiales bacterium]MDT4910382.1 carbamate kinase [Pseudonocardiales bacterium]MDT4963478.1 carbamate kinase [Pseudonocardiales bacterium]MDT4972055.1 carbamate kinase [Pseudonocardiales bacterium]MDT4976771.1 carbamate kinase [Pseudonocardiales bacterium]
MPVPGVVNSVRPVRVLIALGGNAMTAPDGSARPQDQRAAITAAMESVADIVGSGAEVVLTHGNGPQVGNLLVKNEIAASVVPPVPLDWCGAQTQGTLGLLILDALEAALAARGHTPRVAALVSRTLVAADDPHFAEPSKPIGRYLPVDEAAVMIEHGQTWQDRGEQGWRRVVASPEPIECLEVDAAQVLLGAGYVVVCAGGGGVPVVRASTGDLESVEAVIDKDLTAAVLAGQLGVDVLVIATDVDAAVVGWGTPEAKAIGAVSARELRALAAEGHFAGGSMGPKVDAACRFAETGGRAVITSLNRIAGALAGTAGTIVTS